MNSDPTAASSLFGVNTVKISQHVHSRVLSHYCTKEHPFVAFTVSAICGSYSTDKTLCCALALTNLGPEIRIHLIRSKQDTNNTYTRLLLYLYSITTIVALVPWW